jgi:cell division protease FtsH
LGVTLSAPDADRVFYSREDLETRIRVALGGRVAEELVFGTMTTGAESDIRQLTGIAREMVGRWGMSDRIGPIAVLPDDGAGPQYPGARAQSEDTQQTIDEEVRRLVDDAHADVTRLLTEHRDQLQSLAGALLEAETLDALEAYAAAGVPGRSPRFEQPPAAAIAAGP